MTVQELIEREYGIKTSYHVNRLVDQCQNTVTALLPNDPNRVAFLIVNLSANDVYIHFESDVSSTKGIYLTPNGGSYTALWREDFLLCSLNVFGIAGAANSDILTLEVVIRGPQA